MWLRMHSRVFIELLQPRGRRLATSVVLFILVFPVSFSVFADTTKIGILYSEHSAAQSEVVHEIERILQQSLVNSISVTTIKIESSTVDSLLKAPRDLIITVGLEAALLCRDRCKATSLLRALIPKRTAESVLLNNADVRVYDIYLDQPVPRLMRLLKLALPYDNNVAVLLGPSSSSLESDLGRAGKNHGLTLHIEKVSDQSELITALERLLKQSQVLLAVPDPLIYNRFTVQKILLTTYRHQIPVVSFSAALVRAGASIAVYSSPDQIGRHIGEIAVRIVGKQNPPQSSFPLYYSVTTNHQVARSLGLNLPADESLLDMLLAHER